MDLDNDGAADGVDVHEQFLVGSYEIVILSADDSTSLLGWLASNGYATSDASRDLLQLYIESGSYFFAAKVALSAAESGFLEPLQIGYDNTGFGLPIRLGTLNSGGCTQDLIIYLVTPRDDGLVQISNYPEAIVPDDCLWDHTEWASFDEFYTYQLETVTAAPGLEWVTEYGWPSNGCDPCSVPSLTDDELNRLGFVGAASDAYTTRLRLRYTSEEAYADLVFHTTGTQPLIQQRYIVHDAAFEGTYPVCNRGFVPDPLDCDGNAVPSGGGEYFDGTLPPLPAEDPTCPSLVNPPSDPPTTAATDPTESPMPELEESAADDGRGCGCAGGPAPSVWFALGAAAFLRPRVRRREHG